MRRRGLPLPLPSEASPTPRPTSGCRRSSRSLRAASLGTPPFVPWGGPSRPAKDAVPALVAVLRGGDGADRKASALALSRIGGPATSALVVLLRDKDASLRRLAAETLDQQMQLFSKPNPGPAARVAIPTLVEALQGADVEFAKHAANILPRIGKEALPALFEAPRDKQGRFQGAGRTCHRRYCPDD